MSKMISMRELLGNASVRGKDQEGEKGQVKEQVILSMPQAQPETCCVCRGSGWLRADVPYGHPQFGKPVACLCLERKRREKQQAMLLELSGLASLPERTTLSHFQSQVKGVRQAVKVVRTFVDQMKEIEGTEGQRRSHLLSTLGWIVLQGPTGVGKTHLAMGIANEAIERLVVTLFATVPDVLAYLRAAYGKTAQTSHEELFEQMRNAEVLILDDLGAQRSSPWADEELFRLINHRYLRQLPTIITMNERAWPHLEERIQSRLSDRRLVTMVDMAEANDYRRREEEHGDEHLMSL